MRREIEFAASLAIAAARFDSVSPEKAEPFRTSRGKAQESVAHKKKIATIAGQIPDFQLYNFKY